MRDKFGIFGTVIRIRKLSLLLVMMLRIPNNGQSGIPNYCYQTALLRPASLKALGYLSDVTIVMVYQHPTFLVPLLMMDL